MEDLQQGAIELGLTLSTGQLAQFSAYYDLLQRWNRRSNLTRIIERQGVIRKHFLDSLSCLLAVPTLPHRVIDVGSGPGFPGLVLKIAQPHIALTLVEATRKKVDFLQYVIQALHLTETRVLPLRAETVGQQIEHRAQYQLATARAVAPLTVLAEYMLPLLQVGGLMLAQKGADPSAEVNDALTAIELLGGRFQQTLPVKVPQLDAARHLVLVEKIKPTPPGYPRKPGKPTKKPL